MSRSTKIWLVIATALVVSGIIMFGVIMSMLKWDFTKLSTVKYETNDYRIDEKFNNISINTDTAGIIFLPSDNGECRVVCYEQTKAKHCVDVSNDTLNVNIINERKWYDYIGINFGAPKITVYLPESEYSTVTVENSTGYIRIPQSFCFEGVSVLMSTGDVECRADVKSSLKISLSTGDIELDNISVGEADLVVTTGDIEINALKCEGGIKINVTTGDAELENVTCKTLLSKGSTGDITLENVIATESFNIERSTGDVTLEGCDAGNIIIKTDTGDVKGSLLSEKVFVTKTDTGKVKVPKTTSGGICEITTDTGNIIIDVK